MASAYALVLIRVSHSTLTHEATIIRSSSSLIPKIQDAKFVKDFRPISLIESVYKIIAKILASRLCAVLPYLISDVQSAFVANRQILDGPFILNELLSWCKFKKLNEMIFKVDFEKAFDSMKWDYLDETLKDLGFGSKWRNSINSCLNNAMGSVLVNGSPTLEFQFHKGLKQVFIGEWNNNNIQTLLSVLRCFYLDSCLKINLHKSKLMGIGVSSNVVAAAASLISCSNLTAPFNYLGVKIGSLLGLAGIWMPRGDVEHENYGLLCSKVTDLVLPNILDRWCLSLEGSQEFSVKSSRILIDNTILPKAEVPTRWLRVVPIKVNVHAWRVCLDKLPTRSNLSLRGMDIPSFAWPLCNSAVESSSHIFFACPLACQVWRNFLIWWELEYVPFNSYNEWLNWIVNIRLHKQLKVFLEVEYYRIFLIGITYKRLMCGRIFRNQMAKFSKILMNNVTTEMNIT
nr:putative RNA-directed DNA polymerase, eukaryota, reverse transcriptase zinc-binding domain protein [Tanacetum cinerariifolium]